MLHLHSNLILNEAQQKAVLHGHGPLVVFAGAGSGKTRVITTRMGHLINNGVPAKKILAVTFTNKAAQEMRERVQASNPEAKYATICTFHSACARWLREFADELGFESDFTIYDDNDAAKALKTLLTNESAKGDLRKISQEFRSFFKFLKINGIEPGQAITHHLPIRIPAGGIEAYRKYQDYLAKCNAMDFGDLLLNMLILLRRNHKVRDILQNRFQFILVDEFQDTNKTQLELVQILSQQHQNLLVVGDDDQSIYSWRGATPAHIIHFSTYFPGASVIKLENNYRCPKNIVEAANALIAHNEVRTQKTLYSEKKSGEPIFFQLESDNTMEAWWTADSIIREKSQFPFDQIAVFFRTNSQSRLIEEEFRKQGIPYRLYGSLEFYERMEVKDITSYLKFISNNLDEVSLLRILNVPPRGLGKKAIATLTRTSIEKRLPLYQTIKLLATEKIPRLSPALSHFIHLTEELKAIASKVPLESLVEKLIDDLQYKDHLKSRFADQYEDKLDNLHELCSGIADYTRRTFNPSLGSWLESISLTNTQSDENDDGSGVSLMTLHTAKGLEFPRVYIIGCEEGLLPHQNSINQQDQLEEERRLMYVGMTRSKEKLSLVAARARHQFNKTSYHPPSRFLREIPAHLIQYAPSLGQLLEDPENIDEIPFEHFQKGIIVFHPTYGKGTVRGVEDHLGRNKATIFFKTVGIRKVLTSQLSTYKTD